MTSPDLSSSFAQMPIGNIADEAEISCLICKAKVANAQLEGHLAVDHMNFVRFSCACCFFGSTYYSAAYAHAHQPGHNVVPFDNAPSNKHLAQLIDYAVVCCRAAHLEALYSDLGSSNASLDAVASQAQPHCIGPAISHHLAKQLPSLAPIPEEAESEGGIRQPSPADSGIADSPGSPPAETFHFRANSSSAFTSAATHPALKSALPPQAVPDVVAPSAKLPGRPALIISEVIGAVGMENGNDSGGNDGSLQQNGPDVAGGPSEGPTQGPVTCAICLAEEGLQVVVDGNEEAKIEHLRSHLKRMGLSLVEDGTGEYYGNLANQWKLCFPADAAESENEAPMEQEGVSVAAETASSEQPRFGTVKKDPAAMVATIDFVAAGGDHSSPASAPVLSSGKSRKRSSSSGTHCKLCKESVAVSKRELYKHAIEHCKILPFRCRYCHFWSLGRQDLYEHLARHHDCTRVDVALEYSADEKARLIATVHSCFNLKRAKTEPNVDTGTQVVKKAPLSANIIQNPGHPGAVSPMPTTSLGMPKQHWKKQIIASTVNEQSTSQKKSPIKRHASASGVAGRKTNQSGNNTAKNLSNSVQKSPSKRSRRMSVSGKVFGQPDIAQAPPVKRVKLATGRRAANRKFGSGGVTKKQASAQKSSRKRRPRASADNEIIQQAIDSSLLPTRNLQASAHKSSVKRRQSTPSVRKPTLSQKLSASGTSIPKQAQAIAPKLPNVLCQNNQSSSNIILTKLSGAGAVKANPNDRAAFDAHLRQCNAGTLESYLKERAQNSAHSFKSAFKACFPRFVASLAEPEFLELALAK